MSIDALINKTGRKIATAGLAGILGLGALGLSPKPAYSQQQAKSASNIQYIHCTPQEQKASQNKDNSNPISSELLTFLGIIGLSNQNQDAKKREAAQNLGAYASELGRMQHEKEVAREGRSQVSVNQGQSQQTTYAPAPGCAWKNPEDPNDLSVRKRIGMPIVATDWRDFNGDGVGDLEEYVGVKKTFYSDERILMVLYGTDPKVKEDIIWEMYYGPNAKKFGEGLITDRKNVPTILMPHGNIPGDYWIVWRSEGIAEIAKFKIVPSPKEDIIVPSPKENNYVALTANYWEDSNKNGVTELNEFVGVKDRFYEDETIILVLYNPVSQGVKREVEWEIHDPKGERYHNIGREKDVGDLKIIRLNPDWLLTGDGGYGTYEIGWRSEGIAKTKKLEIVPASERTKKQ